MRENHRRVDDGDAESSARQPTREQAAAFEVRREDRDRTLEALRALEEALGGAAPGRQIDWLKQVIAAFESLVRALSKELGESNRADSLLSMISRDYPRRFGSRVRHLRGQHVDIYQQATSLRAQLEDMEGAVDFTDLRQRVNSLMGAIYHRRARETDLVYEAIELDLGRPPTSAR